MGKHSNITAIVPDGRLSLLELDKSLPRGKYGWNDFTWHSVARMRYCKAYCHGRIYDALKNRTHTDQGLILQDRLHMPACAYATDRWIPRAIELLQQVNEGR